MGDANPAISPDGRWLIFRRNPSGLFDAELYRLPLGEGMTPAGKPKRITPSALDANYPAWIPGGNRDSIFV
jgi:Tol biopolymer transport system component